jgi:membrane fusion protein (multidrug efflux system)
MNKPTENVAAKAASGSGLGGPILRRVGLAAVAGAALLAALLTWWPALAAHEVTEDAYVDGNVVQVTPQVTGTINFIAADSTDFVTAGQPLVRLNRLDAELALARAESQLAKAVRLARAQYASASQMKANVALRRADLSKAAGDLDRRKQLAAGGGISGEDVRHAEEALRTASAALVVAQQQQLGSAALVDGTTVATHPEVLSAASQVRDACIALERTRLSAPVSGIVTRRNAQLGQRVAAGTVLMSIVPLDHVWISANFKESQLRYIRIGQTVKVTSDLYGSAVAYTGRVVGQEAGTGSAFSLLPAQNATGNWIKVVQRVPVRIVLDKGQLAAHPLKLGLSMRVDVDIRDQSGPATALATSPRQSYSTDVYANEEQQAEQLVREIIQANSGMPLSAS